MSVVGVFFQKGHRFVYRHIQQVGDVFAPIAHLQHLLLIAFALTGVAGKVDVGHKLHFHFHLALALASLAAAALGVERKVAGRVVPFFGQGQGGKEVAQVVKGLDISNGVGTGGTPDRLLVHQLHAAECPHAASQGVELAHGVPGTVELTVERRIEGLLDQGAFARTAHPAHHRQYLQGNFDTEVLQVVFLGPHHLDILFPRPPRKRHRNLQFIAQITGREALPRFYHGLRGAFKHNLAPLSSR